MQGFAGGASAPGKKSGHREPLRCCGRPLHGEAPRQNCLHYFMKFITVLGRWLARAARPDSST
jgi:hypothetical protein